MRIRIYSDLHLETYGPGREWVPPPDDDVDVVILAGDIHKGEKGVYWALKHFTKPVIYVAGNHEHWGSELGRTTTKMFQAAEGTNIHVLQNRAVIIDGVRFLGGTLWTDYRLSGNSEIARWDAQQVMNDFCRIRTESFRRLLPKNLEIEHSRTRHFLKEALKEPFSGPTVVVTHHAPSELSIAPEYKDPASKDWHLNASYASDLQELMGPEVDLWVHGHTHTVFDYEIYGTRVLCNPRGYDRDLVSGFEDRLTLELPEIGMRQRLQSTGGRDGEERRRRIELENRLFPPGLVRELKRGPWPR